MSERAENGNNEALAEPGGRVDLARFSQRGFERGAGPIKEALWLLIRVTLFERYPGKAYGLKAALLRAFGARVGHHVIIKPGARMPPTHLESDQLGALLDYLESLR